jgi:hypothetical protein
MANEKISGLFQKLMQSPNSVQLIEQLFGSMDQNAQRKFLSRPNISSGLAARKTVDAPVEDLIAGKTNGNFGAVGNPELLFNNLLHDDPSIKLNGTPGFTGNAGDIGALALGAAKAHPFKTAGLIGLGAGNIGGLMDNNKFGGQLGGLALGGLGAATLASGNPYLQAMLTMGGGQLGALFDKLRARKEQEQAQVPQYGGR